MRLQAISTFIVFPALIYYLSFYGTPFTLFTIPCAIGGFLLSGLAEYFLHRVAFHNRKLPRKIKRLISHGHVYHHRYPQLSDDLIIPVGIILPVSLILLGSFVLFFGTLYAFWFYVGIISSYFLYEFMHYSAHHFDINLPYFKQMKAYHLSHHLNKPNSKFMITNPLWDYVFNTYK